MRVLVACEFSGTVRNAFAAHGHDAWSCDIEPSETPGNHIQKDVSGILGEGWDLLIAHPPCTYLCNSGVCHLHTEQGRWLKMLSAVRFFKLFLSAPISLVAIENPTMHKYASRHLPRPSQAVQPYEYGHTQSKRTCLWLRGLPPLLETNNVQEEMMKLPLKERQPLWWGGSRKAKDRSRTFRGIADAMAEQWGSLA